MFKKNKEYTHDVAFYKPLDAVLLNVVFLEDGYSKVVVYYVLYNTKKTTVYVKNNILKKCIRYPCNTRCKLNLFYKGEQVVCYSVAQNFPADLQV